MSQSQEDMAIFIKNQYYNELLCHRNYGWDLSLKNQLLTVLWRSSFEKLTTSFYFYAPLPRAMLRWFVLRLEEWVDALMS